jgi:hypothetical protein
MPVNLKEIVAPAYEGRAEDVKDVVKKYIEMFGGGA